MGASPQAPAFDHPDQPHLFTRHELHSLIADKEMMATECKSEHEEQQHKSEKISAPQEEQEGDEVPSIVITKPSQPSSLAVENLTKQQYFQTAREAYHYGNYRQAIDNYKKVIELDPTDSIAYNNLGLALKNTYQFQQATRSYKKALELEPNFAKAYNNLGSVYKNSRQFTAAIVCYEKAIQIDPFYSNAHSNLGNAYKHINHFDDAIKCYRKAAQLNPKNSLIQWNLALGLYSNLRFEDAINEMKKLMRFCKESKKECRSLEMVIGNVNDQEYLQEVQGFLDYVMQSQHGNQEFKAQLTTLKEEVMDKIR